MSLSAYIKSVVWDYLLVVVSAWALEETLFHVFFTPPALQYGPVPLLVTVLLVAALFTVVRRREGRRRLGAAYGIACVVLLAAFGLATGGASLLEDVETNWFYGMLVVVLASTLAFVMTRSMLGAALWFVASVFACALTQFFYGQGAYAWYFVVLVSSLAALIYRNCARNALSAEAVRHVSFPAMFGVSLGAVAVSVLAACAVFFGIVAPLNPSVLDLKLITEHRQENVIMLKGVGSVQMTPNVDTKSDNVQDGGTYTTDDLVVDQSSEYQVPAQSQAVQEAQQRKLDQADKQNTSGGTMDNFNSDINNEEFDPVSYEMSPTMLIVVPLVILALVALIAALFVVRRKKREAYLAKIETLEPARQVAVLYPLITEKLEKVGYRIPAGMTLLEYVRTQSDALAPFMAETRSDFVDMTLVYVGSAYGGMQVTQRDVEPFKTCYRNLWRAARKHWGNVRYFFKSFRF